MNSCVKAAVKWTVRTTQEAWISHKSQKQLNVAVNVQTFNDGMYRATFLFYLLAANVPLFKKKVRGKAYQEKSEKKTREIRSSEGVGGGVTREYWSLSGLAQYLTVCRLKKKKHKTEKHSELHLGHSHQIKQRAWESLT